MKTVPDSITKELVGMNPGQLATVLATVTCLLAQQESPDDMLLYQAMVRTMQLKLPVHVIKAKVPFGKAAASLSKFVDQNLTDKALQKTQRLAVFIFLLEMVIDFLNTRSIPVTLKTVVNSLAGVDNVFDCQFPGYRINGIMHLIVSSVLRRKLVTV